MPGLAYQANSGKEKQRNRYFCQVDNLEKENKIKPLGDYTPAITLSESQPSLAPNMWISYNTSQKIY
jgi:hypothetical protein